MRIPLLLSLTLVSCGTVPSGGNGKEVYRYVNTLDFGNDNTLDQVTVIGYDDNHMREATRLDVTVGSSKITLRDPYDGTSGGAMYNPGVDLMTDGALVVKWAEIGEVHCRAEIIAGPGGKLVERKRVTAD
ncbi:MAG: hypothetical protein V4689_17365 [Verrucomicrobiota bacterium]